MLRGRYLLKSFNICNSCGGILHLKFAFISKNCWTFSCRIKVQKSKEDVSYVIISLKMFSVTGGVFIFTIIDAFLQLSAFSFFTSFLTSLQGVFIFFSFFTSRHVLSLFQSLFERRLTSNLIEASIKNNTKKSAVQQNDRSSDQ